MLGECKSFMEEREMSAKQWAVLPISAATWISFVMCTGSWFLITPAIWIWQPEYMQNDISLFHLRNSAILVKLSGDCNEPSHKTDWENK
jgi:hypothetical protein